MDDDAAESATAGEAGVPQNADMFAGRRAGDAQPLGKLGRGRPALESGEDSGASTAEDGTECEIMPGTCRYDAQDH